MLIRRDRVRSPRAGKPVTGLPVARNGQLPILYGDDETANRQASRL